MAHLFEVKKDKKDSVLSFIEEHFNERKEYMQDLYRTWVLNLAWVRGHQNVDFNPTTNAFSATSKKTPWMPRLISNLMLPIVRRNVSQLIHTSSVWDCIPATADEDDVQISQMSTKILLHYWQTLKMTKQLIRIAFWQSICSSAFLKVGWDADIGDEIQVASKDVEEETLQQFLEMLGLPQAPDLIDVNEGDLFIEPISPFNLTFERTAAVTEDSLYCIESHLRSPDYMVNKYGTKWGKLKETENIELFLYPIIYGSAAPKMPRKGILEHTLYVKKTKKFKKGLYCVVAGGEVIISPQENPFEHGELPFVHFLEIYDPVSLHGTNTVEQVRPQQARYNRVSSAILENINLNSNVQWLNPKQSGIKTFTNKPGGVLNYNAPHEPKQMQTKAMPGYVDSFLDRTRLDMQDTASNHDVSEAKAEPGVRSGRAVLALQDADDSIKGPVLLWFDAAIADTGRLALQTISQYITEKRAVEIRGEFSELEVINFMGADLRGKSKGDYFKVRAKTYGRQPLSRSAREALTRVLIETGLLHPQTHREELLNILGAADILTIYDINSIDRIRQGNEIKVLRKGEEVGVYFGQNHEAHIATLKKFISSSEWDKMKHEEREIISKHVQNHLEQEAIETIYQQLFVQRLMYGQPGSGQGQPGSGQGQTGSGQSGSRQTGSGQSGSRQTGSGQSGSSQGQKT